VNFPEGERKAEQKDKDKKISAAFKDGVSLVHLPKDEKAIPRAKKSRSI
jgi:hypothetical protein